MTFYGAAELDTMLAEFGVPVLLNATCANGIEDTRDDDLLAAVAAHITSKVIAVLVKTGQFNARDLVIGAAITVDGTGYKIAAIHQQDDGALTRLLLVR